MLHFLNVFILLPQLNLSDQNGFLSRGEGGVGYIQGKVTQDQIKHNFFNSRCLFSAHILVITRADLHLYWQDAQFNRQMTVLFT